MSKVQLIDQLRWSFDSGNNQASMRYGSSTLYVDPTPAYHHDVDLVQTLFDKVCEVFPLSITPRVYVFSREDWGRTNGWASPGYKDQWDEEQDRWVIGAGSIGLLGKRIPPHPAMTRYLVAHEYGHHAEYELLKKRGLDTHADDVIKEYAQLRGMEHPAYYGPGVWHMHPKEVFANDFRILVAEAEEEFWPHPTITYPLNDRAVVRYWKEVVS